MTRVAGKFGTGYLPDVALGYAAVLQSGVGQGVLRFDPILLLGTLFILIGMASFILSRFVIQLFTSIGGGALAVLGGITLLMNVPNWDGAIKSSLSANHLVIPLLVLVAAVTGFVRQQGASLGGAPAPKPKPA